MAKWVKGLTLGDKERFCPSIIYCDNCKNEAYWDASYGQQLFDYCPFCGAEMENPIDVQP